MGKKAKIDMATTSSRGWKVADKVMNNVDLLTEILLRVPAKSLMRFKCVCKHWRNIISDSNFSLKHTQRNSKLFGSAVYTSNRELFFLSRTGSSSHPNLSFLDELHDNPSRILISSSCHGLIMCSFYRDGTHYVVCNPTTQSYRLLPYHNCVNWNHHIKSEVFMECLCYDPTMSPHYYVVVCRFQFHHTTGSLEIDLFNSEFASWEQRLKLDVPGMWGMIYKHQAFWNGAIHWISQQGYHICFDPYSKKLTGIKLPEYPRILASDKIMFFGVCDGRLFLIQNRKRCPLGFRVLEMGMDYCSWVAKYTVNLRPLMSVVPGLEANLKTYGFRVLIICKESESDDLSLVSRIGRRLISYNVHSKNGMVLLDLLDGNPSHGLLDIRRAYPFFESLSPV